MNNHIEHPTDFRPYCSTDLQKGTRIVSMHWPATILEGYTDFLGRYRYEVLYDEGYTGDCFAQNVAGFIYDYPRPLEVSND